MTPSEFQMQIIRLEKEISAGLAMQQSIRFGAERSKILWSRVHEFSGKWFQHVIDHKIASCRHMPIPADFDEEIAIERERVWSEEKKQNARDAKNFLKDDWGNYQNEEKREICKKIREIFGNKMPESHKQEFIGSLSQGAKRLEKSVENAKAQDA